MRHRRHSWCPDRCRWWYVSWRLPKGCREQRWAQRPPGCSDWGGCVAVAVDGVAGSVAVGGGGALRVSSATTVLAAWVWIMPTSCVGTGVAVRRPQAVMTRLSTARRTEVTKIRELDICLHGYPCMQPGSTPEIRQAKQVCHSAFRSRNRGMGNLSASEYTAKHTRLPPAGHAIKCFIFVIFWRGESEATALG